MPSIVDAPRQQVLVPLADPGVETPDANRPFVSFAGIGAALGRHKLLMLLTVLLVNAVALGLLYLLPAQYTASTTLVVRQADTSALINNPVARGLPEWMPSDNSTMETETSILRTNALATQVVRTMRLTEDPQFQSTWERLSRSAVALADRWLPAAWLASLPRPPPTSDAVAEATAIRKFQQRLSVRQEDKSHVISVGFTADTPELAARVADAVAAQYIALQLQTKYDTTNRAYAWAADQVRQQRLAVTTAENAVVDYMAAHHLTAANGLPQPTQIPEGRSALGGLSGQQLNSLEDDLAAARASLAAAQAKVAVVNAYSPRNYASLPEVANSPVILALQKADATLRTQQAGLASAYRAGNPVLGRVTAEHNTIAQQIEIETANIVQGIRDQEMVARDHVARLEAAMRQGRAEYIASEAASVKLRDLMREAEAKRDLYNKLLLQANQIAEQMVLIQPDATIISAAQIPVQPSFPDKPTLAGAAFIGSLILAVFLAAFFEHNDNTLHTGPEVEWYLKTPFLGLVPRVERRRRFLPRWPMSRRSQPFHTEAMQALLFQVVRRRGLRVVMVTSALPGEGKTSLSFSLARAAAQLDGKALLVDADTRDFSGPPQAASGTSQDVVPHIFSEVALDAAIRPDRVDPRLDILTVSDGLQDDIRRPSRWELPALIGTLRNRYAHIFVDLPPTIAISHIQTLHDLVDGTIFVVQWGKTSRAAAASGLSSLARAGIQVTGVVLTQVNLARHARYGQEQFGEYYRKYMKYFRERRGLA